MEAQVFLLFAIRNIDIFDISSAPMTVMLMWT